MQVTHYWLGLATMFTHNRTSAVWFLVLTGRAFNCSHFQTNILAVLCFAMNHVLLASFVLLFSGVYYQNFHHLFLCGPSRFSTRLDNIELSHKVAVIMSHFPDGRFLVKGTRVYPRVTSLLHDS